MAQGCSNCMFSTPENPKKPQSGKLFCRRYPPVVYPGLRYDLADFPIVSGVSWCGEYKESE